VYAFAFLTSFFATWSWRIDPGVATLIGAIVGLGIVAWQARLGFTNLIRSQENQAAIETEARLHQHQLDIDRERQRANEDRRILMSTLRAEIVGLMQQAQNTMNHANVMRAMLKVMADEKAPDFTTSFTWPTFQAPVYQANLSKMGLLGASLGADVIKVMAMTGRTLPPSTSDKPMPNNVVANFTPA
jgi:hypothetical protein